MAIDCNIDLICVWEVGVPEGAGVPAFTGIPRCEELFSGFSGAYFELQANKSANMTK